MCMRLKHWYVGGVHPRGFTEPFPQFCAIFLSVTEYNKNLSSQCNLTARIEPVQDKIYYKAFMKILRNIYQYTSVIIENVYQYTSVQFLYLHSFNFLSIFKQLFKVEKKILSNLQNNQIIQSISTEIDLNPH